MFPFVSSSKGGSTSETEYLETRLCYGLTISGSSFWLKP